MKMNEILQSIEELRTGATMVINAVNFLANQFSGDMPNDKMKDKVQVLKPQITLEDVRAVLADMSRSGLTLQVRELLQKYGGNKLSEINPDRYEDMLQDAKELQNES